MYEYGKSLGIPDQTRQITVFMDNDLERLAQWYQERTGWDIESVRRHWEDGGAGTIGRDYIVVMGSSPEEQRWTPGYVAYPLAHEIVHTVYQGGLVGWLTDPAAFDEYPRNFIMPAPRWIREGMAMLMPEFALPEHVLRGQREYALSIVENTDLTLADAEIHPTGCIGKQCPADKEAEARAIIDCYYNCGYLATELLASYVGLSRLPDYFMLLEPWMAPPGVREAEIPREGWRLAFERAYGMTIDEFYDLFEEHRAAGFPELEIPETLDR